MAHDLPSPFPLPPFSLSLSLSLSLPFPPFCLKVQNRKLSERLRERNRRQQQMESELQKSEDLRLVHLRVVCGLGRRMSLLHEHLGLLFTTFGAEMESEGVREDLVRGLAGREEEAGEEELERLFESVLRTVRVLQEKGQEAMVAGLKEAGDTAGDKVLYVCA